MDPLPAQTPSPILTPSLCFNTRYLQDFLRLSRSQLDDTISTNLNSLLTPSRTAPFDPSSTSNPSTSTRRPRQPIPSSTCTSFLDTILYPSWSTRSAVLSYCSIVAASPDPDDPSKPEIDAENLAHAQARVNERLDPYSGRFFPKEPRTEMLAAVLRNESAVENIVRERTWRTLGERCETLGSIPGEVGIGRWEDGFERWRKTKA